MCNYTSIILINIFIICFHIVRKVLYPCQYCRKHFNEMMSKYTIPNENRNKLAEFFCDIHNEVNERLQKEIFDCKKVFDLWGGDCGCNIKE